MHHGGYRRWRAPFHCLEQPVVAFACFAWMQTTTGLWLLKADSSCQSLHEDWLNFQACLQLPQPMACILIFNFIQFNTFVPVGAEDHLATFLGGAVNLEMVRLLKGQVDPDNLFKNHQFEGLLPLIPQI